VNSLQIRADRELERIDRKVGKAATYMIPTDSTTDDDGNTVVTYDEIPVMVRSAGLTALERSELAASGFGQVDAVWKMRHAYVEDVRADHVIKIASFYYQIMAKGATLDTLELLWTIITHRRE
jgi:hypothetical protein